jgi:hypothetical protein
MEAYPRVMEARSVVLEACYYYLGVLLLSLSVKAWRFTPRKLYRLGPPGRTEAHDKVFEAQSGFWSHLFIHSLFGTVQVSATLQAVFMKNSPSFVQTKFFCARN